MKNLRGYIEMVLRVVTVMLILVSLFSQPNGWVKAEGELEVALAWVAENTTITGDISTGIVATFPATIPEIVATAGYQINSRIILGEELPAGTKVTVTRNGDSYLTDITFTGTDHWVTDLFGYPTSYASPFDVNYGGQVETYVFTFTANPVPIDTTLTLKSIISRDVFVDELFELESATFDLAQDVLDPELALQYVKDNTTLSGTLDALTAEFPSHIPAVLISEGYKINSLMTLGEALPAGSTVSILLSVNGGDPFPYVTDVEIPGTSFWVTDLIPGSVAADFDSNYASRVEVYAITITSGGGNPDPVNTNVKIESIISKDAFVTREVLAAITLGIELPADEAAAVQFVKDNTTLSGSLAALTAEFPERIPAVLLSEGYQINSLMTLGEALPGGSTVSIVLSINGGDPFAYVTDVEIPGISFWVTQLIPGAVAADFDDGYGGRVEVYSISISRGDYPIDFTTQVTIQSIISKDGFVTRQVLDEISIPIHFDDNTAPVITITGLTSDTDTLAGDLDTGYLLETMGDPATNHSLQLAAGTGSNETLADSYFGLLLTDSTVPAEDLKIYYRMSGFTGEQLEYLDSIANGNEPFAYLKGDTVQLIDAFQHDINATDTDWQVADDFPVGSYTLTGYVQDLAGNPAEVILILHVTDGQSGTKPTFRVYPDNTSNYIAGDNWSPDRSVYLSIDGVLQGSLIPNSSGSVTFSDIDLDLSPGMLVKMFDGRLTRTHTIIDLTVTSIDMVGNRVSGTADPGLVDTMLYSKSNSYESTEWITTTANSQRIWTVTYIRVKIAQGSYGSVQQFDEMGNSTRIYWELPQAYMVVLPDSDQIYGYGFTPGILVNLNINSGGYTASTSPAGNGDVGFYLSGIFDIQAGQTVTLQQGFVTRTHIVKDIAVTGIDQAGDDVLGTATPGSTFSVAAIDDIGYGSSIDVTADSTGHWLADFTSIEDLKVGTSGYVLQGDADLDYTRVDYLVMHELPVISSLSPSYTTTGSPATTLVVKGDHFEEGISTVYWNNSPRPTTFIDSTTLSISLTGDDLAEAGTAAVEVFNDYSDSGFSGHSLEFHILGFSPALGHELGRTIVTFDWDDLPGVVKYKFQLSTDPDFATLLVNTIITGSVYAYTTPLQNARTYYWRIQPRYGLTWSGEWSPVLYFLSRNPPAAPALSAPTFKLTNVNDITLEWQAADRAERYLVQIATDPLFTRSQKATLSPGILQSSLDDLVDGKYYWRVRGIRNVDGVVLKGPWSAVWSFTIDTRPPAVPALSTPKDGAKKAITPAFYWYAASGARTYYFEYGATPGFTTAEYVSGPLTLLSFSPPEMPPGIHYWRVRARDKAGNESVSLERLITIGLP